MIYYLLPRGINDIYQTIFSILFFPQRRSKGHLNQQCWIGYTLEKEYSPKVEQTVQTNSTYQSLFR